MVTVPMDVDVGNPECYQGQYSLTPGRYYQAPGQTDDDWILDVDGKRLVPTFATVQAVSYRGIDGPLERAMLHTFTAPRRTQMTEHTEHHHAMSYADAIRTYRTDKDAYFRTGRGSPVPAEDRATFAGIPYFPVDEAFIAEGLALEPYGGADPLRFEIPTTDGRLRPAERAGEFRFDLMGSPQRLTAYRIANAHGETGETLFVPFLDATTGTETYGAGRYLDLEPDDDGTWTLDFNLAYHPSCVYDPRFSCPLTPSENRLGVRVAAGERLAPDHEAPES